MSLVDVQPGEIRSDIFGVKLGLALYSGKVVSDMKGAGDHQFNKRGPLSFNEFLHTCHSWMTP